MHLHNCKCFQEHPRMLLQSLRKKRRNCDRRVMCNTTRGIDAGGGVICYRGVSDGSDGARPLWRSHSARTEMFFAYAHLLGLECIEGERAQVKTVVGWYTSRGVSGAWRVNRGRLACFSSVFVDTEDRNDVSRQWYDAWPLDTWVDSPIFRWPRETFLPMLVKKPAEYSEPDNDDEIREALHPLQDRNENALPGAPPPRKAVPFCSLSAQVRHSNWWLTKWFADHVAIFHLYAEMGNDERKEMKLKFHDLPKPSEFMMTPKAGRTGLNLTAGNHAVITRKCWVLNEQRQAFAQVVRLWQIRVRHTWLQNMGPRVFDDSASDLHQHSGVAQMKALHGLLRRLNITTMMIYWII